MDQIEILIRIQQLCDTVREGAGHLAEHPESSAMIPDVTAGIDALERSLTAENAMTDAVAQACRRLRQVLSSGAPDPERLRRVAGLLRNTVAAAVAGALDSALSGAARLSRESAGKIFRFYDGVPYADAAIYQLLFDTCMKSSRSAPRETFDYMLKLFAEQPDILSGAQYAHPGYVYRPAEQRAFERCPICGGEGEPYYSALSYGVIDFGPPHLPVKLWMKCGRCENLYTWKYPEELLRLSDRGEWVYPDPEQRLTATEQTGSSSLAVWSGILNKLRARCSGNTLLEVGIGRGELLAVALELGLKADAVELVPEEARRVANILNIPIWAGDFLNYEPGKTYSMITMGDVIEHVTDPERALRNAYRLLEDDGVLWLSTPNFESSFSRMMKFSDPMWKEPHHISYFSRPGIERLAAKCGFAVREYCVSSRYNGSMELVLKKSRGP